MADVPPHLRRYVVEQDYARYDAIDQAVWRFVLLQLRAQLDGRAHPSYRTGLEATGISVDRIPHIGEMNDKLARFGWGAVCVDGFVPPRVFQEFQAAGILPIAADIRSRQNLPYTPAPDVIHEAAGHAPILPDPVYAAFLRRLGRLGARAFAVPEEGAVFDAIHALSELKERPGATTDEVVRAEARLEAAGRAVPEVSEAATLSRLYWWTAEYGLVGGVDDFKIYGAGLLSSLGESHSCRGPAVRKLPLDEGCLEVAYDITRPQPQLFVTHAFEDLHELLDRVERRMRRDLQTALQRALRSHDTSTILFSSGASAIGVLTEVGWPGGASTRAEGTTRVGRATPDGAGLGEPAWLEFEGGRFAVVDEHATWPMFGPVPESSGAGLASPPALLVVGRAIGGLPLERLGAAEIAAHRVGSTGNHRFAFEGGPVLEGRLTGRVQRRDGRLGCLELACARVALPGRAERRFERYQLWATGDVVEAHAGVSHPAFYTDLENVREEAAGQAFSRVPAPRQRRPSPEERDLLSLYEHLDRSAKILGNAELVDCLTSIEDSVRRDHPEDWLLLWNLLESLGRTPIAGSRASALRAVVEADLAALEIALGHRQPIATGLAYLRQIFASRQVEGPDDSTNAPIR
jgi:phenylalanine-4-hydroxylase